MYERTHTQHAVCVPMQCCVCYVTDRWVLFVVLRILFSDLSSSLYGILLELHINKYPIRRMHTTYVCVCVYGTKQIIETVMHSICCCGCRGFALYCYKLFSQRCVPAKEVGASVCFWGRRRRYFANIYDVCNR